MTELKLLTELFGMLDSNQMALQACMEEIALWIRQRGATDVVDNVTSALETLSDNAQTIARGIAQLTVAAAAE